MEHTNSGVQFRPIFNLLHLLFPPPVSFDDSGIRIKYTNSRSIRVLSLDSQSLLVRLPSSDIRGRLFFLDSRSQCLPSLNPLGAEPGILVLQAMQQLPAVLVNHTGLPTLASCRSNGPLCTSINF